MDVRHLRGIALAATLALVVGGCGGSEEEEPATEVATEAATEFEAGTRMAEIADAGRIKIGVKKDQPGVGFQEPGADEPTGFDVEVAKIIAAKLGIEPGNIEWVEAVSKNREPFLQKGTVDLVAASYSITDERKQIVGQAGPYYVTGQQLMVREEDKETIAGLDDLKGKKVCSVTGSTPSENIREYLADPGQLVLFDEYSQCADALGNGQVAAVTTDNVILLGFVAESDGAFKLVGEQFTEEPYGIGIKKGDVAFCEFINETLAANEEAYAKAWESTAGQVEGAETPTLPEPAPCS